MRSEVIEKYAADLYNRDHENITRQCFVRRAEITESMTNRGFGRSNMHFQELLANMVEEAKALADALIQSRIRATKLSSKTLTSAEFQDLERQALDLWRTRWKEALRILRENLREWDFDSFWNDLFRAINRDFVGHQGEMLRDIRILAIEHGAGDAYVAATSEPAEFRDVPTRPSYEPPIGTVPFSFNESGDSAHRVVLADTSADRTPMERASHDDEPAPGSVRSDSKVANIRARHCKNAGRVLAVLERLDKDGREFIPRRELNQLGIPPTSVDADSADKPGIKRGGQADGGGQVEFRREYLIDFVENRWMPRASKA